MPIAEYLVKYNLKFWRNHKMLPPVLMYHMFDASINCSISMDPELFEAQLSILKKINT